ncbi:hypothetical protein BDZ91DRAFT_728393 [Kalaharituber pfeilii]|nr:hypothetical protein BDZ91DRAFT_728393 [Kalaharituber pfeilii]
MAGPTCRHEMLQNELDLTGLAGPIRRREMSQNVLNFIRIAGLGLSARDDAE